MSADLIAIAAATFAGQGFLLALVVVSLGRGRALANHLLAALIAVIAMRMAVFHLLAQGWSHPIVLGPLSQVFFLGGPLLYLYARALMEPRFRLRRRHLWLALPPLLSAALTPLLYSPHSFAGGVPAALDAGLQQLHIVHKLIGVFGFGFYAALAMRALRRRQPATATDTLTWLADLLTLSMITALAVAAWNLHMLLAAQPRLAWAEALEFCGNALLFYFTAAVGIRRHIRFDVALECNAALAVVTAPAEPLPPAEPEPPPAVDIEPEPARYQRTSLSETRAQQLWQQVTAHMDAEEPYLDSALSLADLAAAVDSYPRELSQVLNTVGRQNFYDFVNGYRAAKARELIRRDRDGTAMVDIALAAGFNGRSSLYKYFSKCFAVTPSQFRKTLGSTPHHA